MNIYKTTNLINGKIYIGKEESNKPKPNYYGSGKLIRRAIEKYGVINFSKEILEYTEDKKYLHEREKYWIELYASKDLEIGYNISSGGDGGQTAASEKLSEIAKNLWLDDEYRRKQKISRTGRSIWNRGMKNAFTGETKNKMSNAKNGVKLKEQHRESIRVSLYKRKYKQVKCIDTDEIFNSISSIIRIVNLRGFPNRIKKLKVGETLIFNGVSYIKL
jgi:group I intron endonuclease